MRRQTDGAWKLIVGGPMAADEEPAPPLNRSIGPWTCSHRPSIREI
jgi:hypothetical protein